MILKRVAEAVEALCTLSLAQTTHMYLMIVPTILYSLYTDGCRASTA